MPELDGYQQIVEKVNRRSMQRAKDRAAGKDGGETPHHLNPLGIIEHD